MRRPWLRALEPRQRATAAQLYAAYQATNIYGYWLNVPVWSACPTGNAPAAIGFLQQVYCIT